MRWKTLILPVLITLCLAFSYSSIPEPEPTPALLAQSYTPIEINWEEVKLVQDENGSSDVETGNLNDPVGIPSGLAYGSKLDSLNGVYVYYNRGHGARGKKRHKTEDGYNLGLRWQCVEFVKRYYYEHYGHKMPKDRGHAKTFYKKGLNDGEFNEERGLYQFAYLSEYKPTKGEIIVFRNSGKYGHVAIISAVYDDRIEIIEQNSSVTRREFELHRNESGKWWIKNRNGSEFILGRLGFVDTDNFSKFEDTIRSYDNSTERRASEANRPDSLETARQN